MTPRLSLLVAFVTCMDANAHASVIVSASRFAAHARSLSALTTPALPGAAAKRSSPEPGDAHVIAQTSARINEQGQQGQLIQSGPAALVGSLDFVFHRPRTFFAIATRDSVVLMLDRASLQRMASERPLVHACVLELMLRASLTAALSLDRSLR